jgi:hypothetical protein
VCLGCSFIPLFLLLLVVVAPAKPHLLSSRRARRLFQLVCLLIVPLNDVSLNFQN